MIIYAGGGAKFKPRDKIEALLHLITASIIVVLAFSITSDISGILPVTIRVFVVAAFLSYLWECYLIVFKNKVADSGKGGSLEIKSKRETLLYLFLIGMILIIVLSTFPYKELKEDLFSRVWLIFILALCIPTFIIYLRRYLLLSKKKD